MVTDFVLFACFFFEGGGGIILFVVDKIKVKVLHIKKLTYLSLMKGP